MRLPISLKIFLSVILYLLLMSSVFYWLMSGQLKNNRIEEKIIDTQTELVFMQETLQFLVAENKAAQIQKTVTSLGISIDLNEAFLLNPDGRVIAATHIAQIGKYYSELVSPSLYGQLQDNINKSKNHMKNTLWQSKNQQHAYGITPIRMGRAAGSVRSDQIGILYLHVDMQEVDAEVDELLYSSLAPGLIVAMLFGLGLASYFHFSIGRRIKILSDATKHFTDNDFEIHVEITGNDELSDLGRVINQSARQIKTEHDKVLFQGKRLIQTQEIAHLGSWEFDPVNDVLEWSDETYRIFGYKREDISLAFEHFVDSIHPDDRERALGAYTTSIDENRDEYEVEHRIIKHDTGETRYVYEKCIHERDATGKILRSVGMVHDLTDKLQAEQELHKLNRQFYNVFQTSPAAIIITNIDTGKIVDVNSTFEKMLCFKRNEILGKSVIDIMVWKHPDDRPNVMSKIKKDGNIHLPDFETVTSTGDTLIVDLYSTLFDDSESNLIVSSFVDVTDRLKAEEGLRRSQKMDALGKLTGGIAHDYNNMLGVILGFSELLEASLSDQPKLKSYASEVYRAGQRGAKLTEKLLGFSRHKSTNNEVLYINTLLTDQQHLLEKTLTARIKLVLNLGDNIWPVNIDSSDFDDTILNLCINAMHAISGSGELTIETKNAKINTEPKDSLDLSPGDYVVLSVSDTGCGMSQSVIEKVFDPFYSTKGQLGTGLGLSQVYGFVQRCDGKVEVSSEINAGSTFSLYFPRCEVDSPQVDDKQSVDSSDLRGDESILVVDDEPALLALTEELLQQKGYTIFTAESASQAMGILADTEIHLLLSDVIMPEVDGYQFASMVSEKYPDIKIQLVSGFNDEGDYSKFSSNLFQNILNKPYKANVLYKHIRDLLDS